MGTPAAEKLLCRVGHKALFQRHYRLWCVVWEESRLEIRPRRKPGLLQAGLIWGEHCNWSSRKFPHLVESLFALLDSGVTVNPAAPSMSPLLLSRMLYKILLDQ